MDRRRDIDFDLLRSVIILSAAVMHCHSSLDLGVLSYPSRLLQHYIVTVGGFFFFTAGFMARQIYLPRFRQSAADVSQRVLVKGLRILLLYVGYVVLMHILTQTPWPGSLYAFLFDHRFYTKVLFTFALLFMLTPAILACVAWSRWVGVILAGLCVIGTLIYQPAWPLPQPLRGVLFDRTLFLYPLVPSLVSYAAGFLAAAWQHAWIPARPPLWVADAIVVGLTAHVVLALYWPTWDAFVADRRTFTFIEMATPLLLIVATKAVTAREWPARVLASANVLCLGVASLDFYVISNLLLGLIAISPASPLWVKAIGTLCILSLAYTATRWHFRARYDPVTLGRR